jgi:hypothetical protein
MFSSILYKYTTTFKFYHPDQKCLAISFALMNIYLEERGALIFYGIIKEKNGYIQ